MSLSPKRPTTPARAAASRANGAKSRGPRTLRGKYNSSLNGIRHGLGAQIHLLPGERPDLFHDLFTQFHDDLRPSTPIQRVLVEKMAISWWKTQRVWGLESARLAHEIRQGVDAHSFPQDAHPALCGALAIAEITKQDRTLELFSRAESRYERHFHRALRELRELKSLPPDFDNDQPGDDDPAPPVCPPPAPKTSPQTPEPRETKQPASQVPATYPSSSLSSSAFIRGHMAFSALISGVIKVMRLYRPVPALCALAISAVFALAQTPAPITALTHATVIDGTGRPPARDTTIVMSGGRIAAMGPASKIKPPAGAEVIDLTGKTVIPGIWDLHTHIGIDTPAKIAMYAHYGVTSVIGMGGDGDEVLKLRNAQREPGNPPTGGSRIYTVQQRFEFEKGGPEQARMMVDALVAKHVDAVKVVVDDRRGKAVKLPQDFAAAAIDEAHKNHLKALAHIHDLEDARFLVLHGIDMLAHQVRDKEIDDAFISEMKKRRVTVTSTITRELSDYCWADSPEFLNDPFLAKFYPAPRIAELRTTFKERQASNPEILLNRRDFEMATKNLRKMHEAGLRIGFGTDSGNGNPRLEGYFDHLEMEYMVKYGGMTPMEVITAYAKVNTETLGIDKDYGTLATGKVADLLVLDKSPLDDITNTKSLRTVYIGGRKFE